MGAAQAFRYMFQDSVVPTLWKFKFCVVIVIVKLIKCLQNRYSTELKWVAPHKPHIRNSRYFIEIT